MGSWVQAYVNAPTFLGAGGSPPGSLGGGPFTAGLAATQALPDANGQLRLNYSCGCGNCGCSNTAAPLCDTMGGVQNVFLALNWLAVAC
jgi:hypothetical protein